MPKCRAMLIDHGKIIEMFILHTKDNLALFERFAFSRKRQVANTRSRNFCVRLGVRYSLSHILVFLLCCLSRNSQFSCFVFILIVVFTKTVFFNFVSLIFRRWSLALILSVIRSCVFTENSMPSFTSKFNLCIPSSLSSGKINAHLLNTFRDSVCS